jgi:hypothetical protein
VQWVCPYVYLGKKKEKKGLTIITMMNMWNNEFKIENVFIHPINILPNVVPNETYIIVSLSLSFYTPNQLTNKTRGVSHCSLAIYIKKYLKAKDKLWKFKYFTLQKYNLPKNCFKRDQNPSRYQNSITNFKFQHKPKISSFKNPHIKIDLLLLPSGKKSLKLV